MLHDTISIKERKTSSMHCNCSIRCCRETETYKAEVLSYLSTTFKTIKNKNQVNLATTLEGK